MKEQLIGKDVTQQYALLVDPTTGREFNLCRYTTSVGRSISCDIILTDKSVSRQHAVILCLSGKFFIEDVGSTNGTMVNGNLVDKRTPLAAGDEIALGVTRLVFLLIPNRKANSNVFIEPEPTVVNP